MSSWRIATISSHPTIDAKFAIDGVKETLEQVKNLLKQELSINVKLDGLTTKLSDIDTAVKGAVSRNSAKLGNYKMPVKLRET